MPPAVAAAARGVRGPLRRSCVEEDPSEVMLDRRVLVALLLLLSTLLRRECCGELRTEEGADLGGAGLILGAKLCCLKSSSSSAFRSRRAYDEHDKRGWHSQ